MDIKSVITTFGCCFFPDNISWVGNVFLRPFAPEAALSCQLELFCSPPNSVRISPPSKQLHWLRIPRFADQIFHDCGRFKVCGFWHNAFGREGPRLTAGTLIGLHLYPWDGTKRCALECNFFMPCWRVFFAVPTGNHNTQEPQSPKPHFLLEWVLSVRQCIFFAS